MPDLLVHLLKLRPLEPLLIQLKEARVNIRCAQPFEISSVRRFIENDFSVAWADEISVGFANKPVTVYIATSEGVVIGFAGYECTRKAFFGPTGVAEGERGHGIGKALLIVSLLACANSATFTETLAARGRLSFIVTQFERL